MLKFHTHYVHKINKQAIVKKYQHLVNKIFNKLEDQDLPGVDMTG
jgi:hypothetical protein